MNPNRIVVKPQHVLDVVSGELQPERAVVVEDGADRRRGGRRTTPADVAGRRPAGHTLLPGLIDCHAHLVGEEDNGHGYTELLTRTGAQEAMTGVRNARDTLLAGFTTVRDVGTYRAFVDVALRDAIEAGWVPGPRMMVAGALRHLLRRRGRHQRPRARRRAGVPAELRVGVVDTVDDVRRAVRRILHGGADLVKLIATGAVMYDSGVPRRRPSSPRTRSAPPSRRPR